MWMTLDNRSSAILTRLIEAPSYVSIQELMELMNVSRRTIYYDVQRINDWLEENALLPVQYIRGTGFYLEKDTKEAIPKKMKALNKWHYEYSPKERKAWLAIHLLMRERNLYLNDLMECIRVSRNTTLEDLRKLSADLKKFNLGLENERGKGYFIAGTELAKRNALVYFLSNAVTKHGWEQLLDDLQQALQETGFVAEDIKVVYQFVAESEELLKLQYTDDVTQSLSIHLYLFSKRVIKGKTVIMDAVEKEILALTKEYLAAEHISTQFKRVFDISFPSDEVFFVTTHLLSSRVNNQELIEPENSTLSLLKEISKRMLDDFQKYACVTFHAREEIARNLLLHLKPAYYRIKYGIEVENPLAQSIKHNYEDVFILTKKVIHHLEKAIGKKVNDDEIAFLAVHFGGWMNREGAVPAARKKAVIVCPNGVGTSRMVQSQLEALLPMIDIVGAISKREYDEQPVNSDMVFSTIPVKERGAPVFVVNPILNEAEKQKLLSWSNAISNNSKTSSHYYQALIDIIEKHATIHDQQQLINELRHFLTQPSMVKEVYKPMLSELIKEDHILFEDHVESWEEAVKIACEPLVTSQAITTNYVDAIIKNVHELGPYIVIAPKVAIPHARPEFGVNRIGMSFLRVKEDVSFSPDGQHNANLIIVLAAIDNESHLRALSQLTTMLSEDGNIDRLVEAETAEQVLSLVNRYSKS